MKTWMWILFGVGGMYLLSRTASVTGGVSSITDADKQAIAAAVQSRTTSYVDVEVTQQATGGPIFVTVLCQGGPSPTSQYGSPSRTSQYVTVADAVANAGC